MNIPFLNNPAPTYSESNGHYERVPKRIHDFVLIQNEKGHVIFETTSEEFCDKGGKVQIHIKRTGETKWHVHAEYANGGGGWAVTPDVDLHTDKIARKRAFWHAAQYMAGRDLSHKERFTMVYQSSHGSDENLFEDDAFFENGNPVTSDPFGEFLS